MRGTGRQWFTVLSTALILATTACGGDRHAPLSEELDVLPIPAGVTFVADVNFGSDTGFAGSDPSVHRYYITQESAGSLCADLRAAFAELTESSRGGAACTFQGDSPQGRPLTMTVTGPQSSVPAGNEANRPVPIDVPHEAVLIVALG